MELLAAKEYQKRLKEERLAEEKLVRYHNLQYMVITIIVTTIFVLLLLLGFFSVSQLTLRVVNFLSFISFFEFIIMLLDTKIHQFTQGEPFKIWLIKIGLLSALFPLHHYLETKVINYLLEKQLIERKSFTHLRKLFFDKKKSPPVITLEGEDTLDGEVTLEGEDISLQQGNAAENY